jgi:hypothetical protein
VKRVIALAAVAAALAAAAVAFAAQGTGLAGRWTFTVQTPTGTLPVPMQFKHNGEGTAELGQRLPLVYRQNGASFSISIEVPAEASPNGQAFTLVLRGTQTSDTTAAGTALTITDVPDPTSSSGVVVVTGAFTAQRS